MTFVCCLRSHGLRLFSYDLVYDINKVLSFQSFPIQVL